MKFYLFQRKSIATQPQPLFIGAPAIGSLPPDKTDKKPSPHNSRIDC
jgi:hypothetical protein